MRWSLPNVQALVRSRCTICNGAQIQLDVERAKIGSCNTIQRTIIDRVVYCTGICWSLLTIEATMTTAKLVSRRLERKLKPEASNPIFEIRFNHLV